MLEKYHCWDRAFRLVLMLAVASVATSVLLFVHASAMDTELAQFQVGTATIVAAVLVVFLFARSFQTSWIGVLALGLAVTGPWWSYALGIAFAIVWPLWIDRAAPVQARLIGVLPVAAAGLAANLLPDTVSGRDVTITALYIFAGIVPALLITWAYRKQYEELLEAA